MSTMTKAAKTVSCDCAVPQCDCGGAGCGVCQATAFSRPRFFAGQLLTEEDLELLTSYVVGKNRLRNRHLFGEGVACGLEVLPHPCGGGQVIVKPGYALDCCGNDLVLKCEQTLDINEMLRKLRLRRRNGYDCGDPCSDDEIRNARDPAVADAAGNVSQDKARKYYLYINYCEEPGELVTPYDTGEPCGAASCEPSRIHEGVCFELDCAVDPPPPPNLVSHIADCLGNLAQARKAISDLKAYRTLSLSVAHAYQHIQDNQPVTFGESDIAIIEQANQSIQDFANKIEKGESISESDFRQVLDHFQASASGIARFYLVSSEVITDKTNTSLKKAISMGSAYLKSVQPLVVGNLEILEEYRDRELAKVMTTRALVWIEPEQIQNKPNDLELQLFARGVSYSDATSRLASTALANQRQWVLDRLEFHPRFVESQLYDDVAGIDITARTPIDPNRFRETTGKLVSATMRYLIECICKAINPPCPPCEDPRVLLACVEVQECDVTDICNTKRTFLLSPANLRYWLPVRQLGESLERICCELPDCIEKPEPPITGPPSYQPIYFQSTIGAASNFRPDPSLQAVFDLAGVTQAEAAQVIDITGDVTGIIRDTGISVNFPFEMSPAPAMTARDFEALVKDRRIRAVMDQFVANRLENYQFNVQPEAFTAALESDAVGNVLNERIAAIAAELPTNLRAGDVAAILEKATVKKVVAKQIKENLDARDQTIPPDVLLAALEKPKVAKVLNQKIKALVDDGAAATQPEAVVAALGDEQVEEALAAKVAPLVAADLESVNGALEAQDAKVDALTKSVEKRVTMQGLPNTKVVRDLRAELSAMREENQRLANIVAKLEAKLEG